MFDLKNPSVSGIVAGVISIIFYYINNKMTKKNCENINYFKLFILVFIIVYSIVHINQNNVFGKQSGGGAIHTGIPNF